MRNRMVKGTHLLQVRDYLNSRLGPDTFEQYLREEGGSKSALLPGAWYEVEPLMGVLRRASRQLSNDVETLTSEVARLNAFADLPSLYRVFLRIAQPRRLLHFVPQMWRTYVDFGEGRVVQNEVGHFIGQCDGIPEQFLPWACGCWLGFLPAAVELCGGKTRRSKLLRTWCDGSGYYSFQLEILYT
jgi:uncharacterized protein (TIGR02265 family)